MKVWRRKAENGHRYEMMLFLYWSRVTPHSSRREKRKKANMEMSLMRWKIVFPRAHVWIRAVSMCSNNTLLPHYSIYHVL